MADLDLISVLHPFDYVCKQSDAAKSEGKYRTVRIYDIKLNTKEGKKLLRRLEERTRQGKDQEGAELRPLVQRYIDRLREEESDTFGPTSTPLPKPLQKFEEIADNLLRKDPARFSLYPFKHDGVKVQGNAGAVPGEEEEGAVGGAPEEQRHGTATLVNMAASWVPAWLESLLLFLIPHSCIEELLVNFNIFHVECLKILISKVLGYGIILGSSIVKVPQVIKIVLARSAEGISIYGVLLELTAITNTLAYSYANKYPFSAYGEALFMLFQTAAIAFMVLYFQGKHAAAVGFLGCYAAILSYLLSGMAPMSLLATLHASGMPVVLVSKMIQAIANYRQGHTGQLSAITVFLLTLGSVARIFTSYQETGDSLLIMTYVVSSAANALIALQMVWYWNVSQKPKAE
ncbi:Mannose-P-dolichol utilization defect 1 protein [Branchiostoma belcheri]|nr:Mannose-P-dolichol utilization defect 1 protein [Branchiostoma belcheri]